MISRPGDRMNGRDFRWWHIFSPDLMSDLSPQNAAKRTLATRYQPISVYE